MVVFTALTMTSVAALESLASKGAEEAAVRTQERSVSTMAAFRRAQQRAQVTLETFAIAQELRVRSGTMQQRLLATDAGPDRQLLEMARDRWEKMAQALDTHSAIKRGAWESPERDTEFPFRYLQQSWRTRDYEFALQDADIEDFLAWKGLVNSYAAVLMVLSVALYLFGIALATRTQARAFFRVFATGLLALGVLAAVFVSAVAGMAALRQRADRSAECPFGPNERRVLGLGNAAGMAVVGLDEADRITMEGTERPAARRAAACYALGDEAYVLKKYDAAITLLSHAVAARPHFAYAYLLRANAYYDSGSPAVGGPMSVQDVKALQHAIADFMQAARTFTEDPELLGDIGDAYLQLAILDAPASRGTDPWWLVLWQDKTRLRTWRLNRSITFADKAIAADPDDTVARYNRAVAMFARDGVALATKDAFTKAAQHTPAAETSTMWPTFTDLEKAASWRPDPTEVLAVKEHILQHVGEFGATSAEPRGQSASILRVDILPAGLRWTACLNGVDPEHDALVAAWYYTAQSSVADPAAAVLTDISGRAFPARTGSCGDHGTVYSDMQLYTPPTPVPLCVQPGSYRVELYVNGHLLGRLQERTRPDFPALRRRVTPDQEMGMCRPSGWERYGGSVVGFSDGYVAPDHTRGVLTYRFQHLTTPMDDWNATSGFYMARALDDLRSRQGPLMSPAGETSEACTALRFRRFERQHNPWHRYAWYAYGGDGCVFARTDIWDTGTVVVDLVFGPKSFFANREAFDLLESIWIGQEPSLLKPVSIVAPPPNAHPANPVSLIVNTAADLTESGGLTDPIRGTRARVRLHVSIDGRAIAPAAEDWQMVKPGQYEYRLPPLSPGSHTAAVYWADSTSHRVRSRIESVNFSLVP
jgi:tetratricopeptide (TPR) repeat protein